MRLWPLILSGAVTLGLIILLDSRMGQTPAMGRLLSPGHGIWQNAEPGEEDFSMEIQSPYLSDAVKVYLDERLVPHIFAQNENDAYFAQGFVHARFRLWQMEFQVMAAGGRLSEVLGEVSNGLQILEKHDRFMRRLGMNLAADNSMKVVQQSPRDKANLEAYTAGVNAYIGQLSPEKYPIEYKLLGYSPEQWTPRHSALFLKYMSYSLAADLDDLEITTLVHKLGLDVLKDLYPIQPDSLDPIVPTGTTFALTTPRSVQPQKLDSLLRQSSAEFQPAAQSPDKDNGSNNWVVAGTKTASGRPILANDPHLGLSLPAIWYEMQIHTPEFNVYGVTFPGAPSVVIGFNDSIAWGVTNAGRDVMDMYEVKFRDSTMKEYLFNGEWKQTEWRTETIGRRGKADFIDKIALTVWGPVMYDDNYPNLHSGNKTIAVRWKAHDPSMELGAFRSLNYARNYTDYLEAIRQFSTPGQNFVFASKTNEIAIWQQAEFPAKWRRQGETLMPGWDSTFAWQGMIHADDNPHQYNPERGFVSSANQLATDTTYGFFFGSRADVYRGLTINRLLNSMNNITADSMMKMQNNNFNAFAETALPFMLHHVDSAALNGEAQNWLRILGTWDYQANANSKAMTGFFNWWNSFRDTVWRDELTVSNAVRLSSPPDYALIDALKKDSSFRFVDNILTPQVETVGELLAASLNAASANLTGMQHTEWATYKGTRINHLLSTLTGFSRLHLPVGGGEHIINATKSTHGPSWKVVVEMTDTINAWGIYPGGQYGNPGSKYYDQFVDDWAQGKYYKLWFMKPEEQQSEKIHWTMLFHKSG